MHVTRYLVGLFVLLGLGIGGNTQAAPPNPTVIFTDGVGDDRDAISFQLLQPEHRNRVKAIFVTSGNVFLRAAILRQDVRGLGLDIPVYEGTASDLSSDPNTRFAAAFHREGAHTLARSQIEDLRRTAGRSGNAPSQFVKLVAELPPGTHLDVQCMAPVQDLDKGLRLLDPTLRARLGDLFAMGWYTLTSDGRVVLPYNGSASGHSLKYVMDALQGGAFQRVFHVPSDTLQRRSGLPGGYLPQDTENGRALRIRSARAHMAHPGLRQILLSATEYMNSFYNFAMQEYGPSLGGQGYVPENFTGGLETVGVYLGDLGVAYLATLPEEQLAKVWTAPSNLVAKFERGAVVVAPASNGRVISDLQSLDGWQLVERRVQLLEQAAQFTPHERFHQVESEANDTSSAPPTPLPTVEPSAGVSPLIVVFKNSPDDWFSLAAILAIDDLRESLQHGGIVIEGFDSQGIIRNAVRTFLASVGQTGVRVVEGYTYGANEVRNVERLVAEQFMHDNGVLVEAFKDLPRLPETGGTLSTEQLFLQANTFAMSAGRHHPGVGVDLNVLGEGIDYYRWIKNTPQFASAQRYAALMAGGRVPPNAPLDAPLEVTRNWAVHEAEILPLVHHYAGSATVAVLSSNAFGGNLTALTPEGRTVGHQGGAGSAFYDMLIGASAKTPFMLRIAEHWKNWTRAFSHVLKKQDWERKKKADPTEFKDPAPVWNATTPVHSLSIAPLALEVLDKLIAMRGGEPGPHEVVTLSEKLLSPHAIALGEHSVLWMRRDPAQEMEAIVRRFTGVIGNIPAIAAEAQLHQAIRERGPFSEEAANARAALEKALKDTGCSGELAEEGRQNQ